MKRRRAWKRFLRGWHFSASRTLRQICHPSPLSPPLSFPFRLRCNEVIYKEVYNIVSSIELVFLEICIKILIIIQNSLLTRRWYAYRQALEELEDQVWKDSRLLYVLYYCFVCSLKNSYVLQDSIERSSKTPPVFIATNNTVDQSLI